MKELFLPILLLLSSGLVSASTSPGTAVLNPILAELQSESCDLFDDEQGIPHLRGADETVAISCLGLVHARDRLWEMDLFRRTAQGRRAEILGFQEIKSDFIMRILGLEAQARRIFSGLEESQRRVLWAYSYGVNQGIRKYRSTSYEFQELGYEPEAWRPEDTIAMVLLQSFDQTRKTFFTQLQEQAWKSQYGASLTEYKSDELPWDVSILKKGEYTASPSVRKGTGLEALNSPGQDLEFSELKEALGGESLMAAGSNNWVIAPTRSHSEKAWLANDPHLKLHYPAVWHWAHFQGGALDVIGAAVPGIPVIVSGANRHASWGLTNAYLNVSSVALVDKTELKGAAQERPTIWFRWGPLRLPFFFKSFKKVDGIFPVLPVPAPKGKAFVLNWSGFALDSGRFEKSLESLLGVMRSGSAREIDRWLGSVELPTWNFVFADSGGKIGYRAVGLIPRVRSESSLGVAGVRLADWTRQMGRPDWLLESEMPHAMNPARGYIVTANNRQWPADASFHGGRSYQSGFRAFRIEELLLLKARHDLESQQQIQCDVQVTDARFLVPLLVPAVLKALADPGIFPVPDRNRLQLSVRILREWDFEASRECRACALYRLWMTHLKTDYKLNENILYRRLREPDSKTREGLAKSLMKASRQLESVLGTSTPRWGDVHLNFFPHLAGDAWFGTEAISTPGDDHTVSPGTSVFENGRFIHQSGASERLLVKMSDPPVVYSVYPGLARDQQQRNIADPDGPWMKWAACKLEKRNFPLNWEKVPFERLQLR